MQYNTNTRTSTRSELASALAAHTGRHAHAPPSRNTLESRPKDDTHATTQNNTTQPATQTNTQPTQSQPLLPSLARIHRCFVANTCLRAHLTGRPYIPHASQHTHTYTHTPPHITYSQTPSTQPQKPRYNTRYRQSTSHKHHAKTRTPHHAANALDRLAGPHTAPLHTYTQEIHPPRDAGRHPTTQNNTPPTATATVTVTITVIIHNLLAGPHTPETRATYTHTHRVFPQRSLRGA
jgi:hypothetical protein